jgi:hypothetical protein
VKLLFKITLIPLTISFILIALGVSGLYFQFWPTNVDDEPIVLTLQKRNQLAQLLSESKFHEDKKNFYFFPPKESIRKIAENKVNIIILNMIQAAETNPKKSAVLNSLKANLNSLDDQDSEDKDRALVYIEESMEALGINDSTELLNVWRYGFPYGWFLKH